ncbi:MAG: tRNA (adenosine(37)-N6)-threonylcarbamoyltransferase complex transferase subunit TsaD [Oscillospiraceae bacterium]
MKILSIESSCDETAAAVVEERKVLSNVVATQIEQHRVFGGVVPEIASRAHTEAICSVVDEAIRQAGISTSEIDAVAVTFAPGLIGALLVGVNFAKGLAMSLDVPLIPVHHLRSHIAANYIAHSELKPPFLCLMVSGGNSLIVEVIDYTRFNVIGRTRDDAAGECFDKAARAMGMPYPGGVALDKMADKTGADVYKLPHPRIENSKYDFSFSGLKTSVVNLIHNAAQKGDQVDKPLLAGALRSRVCDMLIERTLSAATEFSYKTIVMAGGVSANSELRERMADECRVRNIRLYYPPLEFCGDNAAMVGAQAFYELASGNTADASLNAIATLPIDYR